MTQDTPITWGQMTPEEKGALLLAHHEGKQIEVRGVPNGVWASIESPGWSNFTAYRIKPEPKRETVQIYGRAYPSRRWVFGTSDKEDTHLITFDTIDGEPDYSSIRMEKMP